MRARLSLAVLSLTLLTGASQDTTPCTGLDETKCKANSECVWKAEKEKCKQKKSDNRGRCADDREKFCKDVVGTMEDVFACLKQHESELSPDCKAKLLEGKVPQ